MPIPLNPEAKVDCCYFGSHPNASNVNHGVIFPTEKMKTWEPDLQLVERTLRSCSSEEGYDPTWLEMISTIRERISTLLNIGNMTLQEFVGGPTSIKVEQAITEIGYWARNEFRFWLSGVQQFFFNKNEEHKACYRIWEAINWSGNFIGEWYRTLTEREVERKEAEWERHSGGCVLTGNGFVEAIQARGDGLPVNLESENWQSNTISELKDRMIDANLPDDDPRRRQR
tara:strand:+ start:177 stop:860 length:684 start_codon:yes stop_codon:yes gene_type:complete